jgi:hypothetical protein
MSQRRDPTVAARLRRPGFSLPIQKNPINTLFNLEQTPLRPLLQLHASQRIIG